MGERPVRVLSFWFLRKFDMDEEEVPEFEDRPCPVCGGMITVVKMDHRFLGRYACPHCGAEVLLSDYPDA
jgi:predicted RNA-binding Zn-ribbon protein involved in translation (DUF1610 family)